MLLKAIISAYVTDAETEADALAGSKLNNSLNQTQKTLRIRVQGEQI